MSAEKTERPESRLNDLHTRSLAAQGKRPGKQQFQDACKAWRKAQAAKLEAQKALEAAQEAETKAAEAIIALTGKQPIRMPDDGQIYQPMTRGDTTFFRRQTAEVFEI